MSTKRTHENSMMWIDDGIDTLHKTVRLNAGIDDDSLDLIVTALHLFDDEDCTIILNSGGGDVYAGLAMYDVIKTYPGHVTIKVVGQANSMAAIVLQAADKRMITSSSTIMIHDGVEEPPADHKKNIKAYLKLTDKLDDICDHIVLEKIQMKHPGYSWAKFKKTVVFDTFFTAEQAKHWNLIDEII